MEFCFVGTQATWGGGEVLLAELILGLRELGVGCSVAAPRGSSLARWAADDGMLPLLELPGRARGPRAIWRLRKDAGQLRTDR